METTRAGGRSRRQHGQYRVVQQRIIDKKFDSTAVPGLKEWKAQERAGVMRTFGALCPAFHPSSSPVFELELGLHPYTNRDRDNLSLSSLSTVFLDIHILASVSYALQRDAPLRCRFVFLARHLSNTFNF